MKRIRTRRFVLVIVLLVGIFALIVARLGVPRAVLGSAARAAGLKLSAGTLIWNNDGIRASDLRLDTFHGDPLFAVKQMNVRVSFGTLLARRGAVDVRLDDPTVTLVRHRDGSWNIPGGSATPAPAATPGPTGFNFSLPTGFAGSIAVHNGTVAIEAPQAISPRARDVRATNLSLAANITTAGSLMESGGFDFGGSRLRTSGSIDARDGKTDLGVAGDDVAIAPILNLLIDSAGFSLDDGRLRDANAHLIGLVGHPNGLHIDARAGVEGAVIRIGGLNVPIRDLHGSLRMSEDAVTTSDAHGLLAGVPLGAKGGLFNLPTQPSLDLRAKGRGDVADLKALFAFSSAYPIAGKVSVDTFVSGPVTKPIVYAQVAGAAARFRDMPLRNIAAQVAYSDGDVDIFPARLAYGPISVLGAGTIDTTNDGHSALVVRADAQTRALPYLPMFVPDGATTFIASLTGQTSALSSIITSRAQGSTRTLSLFGHFDGEGRGVIGPLALDDVHGTNLLLGGAEIDHPHHHLEAFARIRGLLFRPTATTPELPGINLPGLPLVSGMLGGRLAASGDEVHPMLAADVTAGDLRSGDYLLGDLDASLLGDLKSFAVRRFSLRGPLARIEAHGIAGSAGTTLRGTIDADLAKLVPGHAAGEVAADVGVLGDSRATVLSLNESAPIRADGIVVGKVHAIVRVPKNGSPSLLASANVAGGELLAGGTLADGIGLSVSDVTADQLVKSPLQGLIDAGAVISLAADATPTNRENLVASPASEPSIRGAALLHDASFQRIPLAVGAAVEGSQSSVSISGGTASFGAAGASFGGRMADLSNAHGPLLAMTTRVRAADLARLIALVPAKNLPPISGHVDVSGSVAGRATSPSFTGSLSAPEASVDGLALSNVGADVVGGVGAVRVRGGTVTVGTSTIAFRGSASPGIIRGGIRSPRLDLADFDDLFDEAGTIAGHGSVALGVDLESNKGRSRGNIALADVAYRNFPIGTIASTWQSSGRRISGKLDVDGGLGDLDIGGNVTLAQTRPMYHPIRRSRVDVSAHASDIELGRVLPLLGQSAPVRGRVTVDARVFGHYPALDVDVKGNVADGSLGAIPITQAQLDVFARGGRGTIRQAAFAIPHLQVDGRGRFGFGPRDTLAVSLSAKSENVGRLGALFTKTALPVDGVLSSTFAISGTPTVPRMQGAADLENAHIGALPVTRTVADFGLVGKQFTLNDVDMTLSHGEIFLAGTLPITLSPFGIGPSNSPLSLDLAVNTVDMKTFAPMFPPKAKLTGVLDGRVALEGSPGNPTLLGALAIRNGNIQSANIPVPVADANGAVRFSGTTATLDHVSASFGGGIVGLAGFVTTKNLTDIPGSLTYNIRASANNAEFDAPSFGHGRITAAVAAERPDVKTDPSVSGTVGLTDALIPLSALLAASGPSTGPNPLASIADLGLDVHLSAGKNVRIRSGVVDLAASGAADLGGTLGSPTLDGKFTSDGGTLTFFNRFFRVQTGTVAFSPDEGVTPRLHAIAATDVADSSSSGASASGDVRVLLAVNGTPSRLKVDLSSEPSYDRQTILGLLLGTPLIGATNVANANGTNRSSSASADNVVQQEAYSVASAQFQQSLLSPISSAIGSAIGLSDLSVGVNPRGFDFSARRKIAGNLSAVLGESMNQTTRQSFGFDFRPNEVTAIALTFYEEQGATSLLRGSSDEATGPGVAGVSGAGILTPENLLGVGTTNGIGTGSLSGVDFSLQRKFQ